MRVLIIEDDGDVASFIRKGLTENGWNVDHADNGKDGLFLAAALVALALKEKTGIPVVYEVRSFFEANWTPNLELEESGEIFRRRMEVERGARPARLGMLADVGQGLLDDAIDVRGRGRRQPVQIAVDLEHDLQLAGPAFLLGSQRREARRKPEVVDLRRPEGVQGRP